MIPLVLKEGLLFASLTVEYAERQFHVANALVDTGSAATVLSAAIAENAGIFYEPADTLRRIRGVGGSEFVYEKTMDAVFIGDVRIPNFAVQISGMDYGFEIDAIIGLDLLTQTQARIDLQRFRLSTSRDDEEQKEGE